MWTWRQRQGELLDPEGEHKAFGYAGGNLGKNDEGKNNPDYQYVPDIGPLPVGKYKFGKPVPQSHLGPFAIPLIPDGGNDMRGRGSFYIHGDTIKNPGCASEGCIILPRPIRDELAASLDNDLLVVTGD